jgi:tetratricopeptide (TPR) repeat protein
VAAVCDEALRAGGALRALFARQAGRRRMDTAASEEHTPAHAEAIEIPGSLLPSSDPGMDSITVPCRRTDGKIMWVSVPRRSFLLGGLAATAGVALPPRLKTGRFIAAQSGDVTPIEHLRSMRRVFIDSDNLLGPHHIIPAVNGYIRLIQQLRTDRDGADREALLHLQAEYAEFASWLYQDAGDFRFAQYWLDRALDWSHAVEDQEMAVYVMTRKSQLAGDMQDPTGAVDLADAGVAMAVPGSRLVATARTQAAHGYALAGDSTECLRSLDQAHDLIARLDDAGHSAWAPWLDDAYVDVQRGRCLTVLGEHGHAAEVFQQAIEDLPTGYRRDCGVYLSREAQAHAGGRDPEQAAATGMQALAIAEETGSGRITNELARLDGALAQWRDVPSVINFRESLTSVIPRQIGSRD